MNLREDRREGGSVLCPQLLPVLVLVKVWSEGSEPCGDTELVFLLLEAVCALEGSVEGMTLQSVVDRLQAMGDGSLAANFRKCIEECSSDLTCFMNLFERSLPSLLSSPNDENTPPLLTTQPLTPVLGVFVSHCVSAYQCLTFSQVLRLHRQWAHTATHTDCWTHSLSRKVTEDKVKTFLEQQDYIAALKELMLPSDRDNLPGNWDTMERDLGSEALGVAALHGHFGHKEEGTRAVHEAIRLALHENNSRLLQHCLAWLHRLEPFAVEDAKSVLKRFVTVAEELKEPLLAGWGKLEESKMLLAQGEAPGKVLQAVLSSQAGERVPIYSPKSDKVAHRGAVSATMATMWEHYGFRHVSQMYCQLQGHMMSCDPPPTEEERESCVLCISLLARRLLLVGDYRAAWRLLQSAKTHLKSSGKSFKLLCQYTEEVGFDWSVQSGDVVTAKSHLARLQVLDSHSALLRSAILSAAEANYTEAQRLARQLLSPSQPQLKSRALELLAEVHCVCGQPSLSLPLLVDSLTLCNAHHLSPYTTQLWMAHAQLQLDSPSASASLARDCLLHFQACDDLVHRGLSQFLLAQATLCISYQQKGQFGKDDAVAVVPALKAAVADFERTSATSHLHKAAVLLAVVYEVAGYTQQRDKMADTALQIHTSNNCTPARL